MRKDDDKDKKDEVEDELMSFIQSAFSDENFGENTVTEDDVDKGNFDLSEKELKELFGDSVRYCSYTIHCNISESPDVVMVNGRIDQFQAFTDTYVHIDLEVPDLDEDCDLKMMVTLDSSLGFEEQSWDKESIDREHDGNHLHFKPFLISALFDEDCLMKPDDTDLLTIDLYKNKKRVEQVNIQVLGPGHDSASFFSEREKLEKELENLDKLPGLDALKQRIYDMVSLCRVNELRLKTGLTWIRPRLHTVLIGGLGSDKSTCIRIMANIYKSLGLIHFSEPTEINISQLQADSINGGLDRLNDKLRGAVSGVLVFENAHELFKEEYKNLDFEPQMIRALIAALNEHYTCANWMLVLTGLPEGTENLLAANPELRYHFNEPIYIDNVRPAEYVTMIDAVCDELKLTLTDAARKKLNMYIVHRQSHGGASLQYGGLVRRVFEDEIVPAMFKRVDAIEQPTVTQLAMVEAEDIPTLNTDATEAMAELEAMVGLGALKTKIKDYLNVIRLASLRMEKGMITRMPRLHMAFLGNPGTGKTTVAEIIGRIFASWGILSNGQVIRTEKSRMVGQYIGETESKMRTLLDRARGNILFIDEAYQLVEGGEKDYGRIVMNSLLTELGKEESDMVVILAGYTAPMKKLLESNEGIESRFPNVFNFEDYTTDELLFMAHIMIEKQGLILADGVEPKIRDIIEEESKKPSPRFGNGRFISNLLQNRILASMGSRLANIDNPTEEQLMTILPEDVVIGKEHKDVVFDDVAIDAALAQLDALSGLDNVKKAVHNFVQSARYLHSIGEPYVGKGLLSWRFIGKSGTGKSTVAEIMAGILKGMHLIASSNITQFKADRLVHVADHVFNDVLSDLVKKSCNGLIFIDADASQLGIYNNEYVNFVERIRLKLEELTVETGGECALILAELDAPNKTVAEELTDSGIYEFDHTVVFKDFTVDELYDILCNCLRKFNISFTPAAENHIKTYITSLNSSFGASARTMKLMSRTIHQQVILRESGLTRRPKVHQVQLSDIETFKWNSRKGRVGY